MQNFKKLVESWSKVGDGDGDGDDGDDGRIFSGHPGPIPNAPRNNISRKGIPSLRYAGVPLLTVKIGVKGN